MKKRKLKRKFKITLIILFVIIVVIVLGCFLLKYNLSSVSKEDNKKIITVEKGSNYISLAELLKSENLIKSACSYKIFVKLYKPSKLEAGEYELSTNMDIKTLVKTLEKGSNSNSKAINITFKEGINIRKLAALIADNTDNSIDDVYNTLNDSDYLDELINKYWFITENIKNDKIYYSLEGYLFPNTYQFKSKEVTVKEIFNKMLDEMDKQLSKYKDDLNNNGYSIHEILTIASIVELEAANSDDRAGVAGVFYNRLKAGWSLGSDVTTYYAAKVDLNERDLYVSELNDYNAYNTRSSKMAGKLPVGPICNASIESIDAAINPTSHKYYYFVADKNKKTYFTKTNSEHLKIIAKLKDEGLWYQY